MKFNSKRLFLIKLIISILFVISAIILYFLSQIILYSIIFLLPIVCIMLSLIEEPTPLLNSKIIINEEDNTIYLINYPVNVPNIRKKFIYTKAINISITDISRFKTFSSGLYYTVFIECKNNLKVRMYLNQAELNFLNKFFYKFFVNNSKILINKKVEVFDADGGNCFIEGFIKYIKFDKRSQCLIVQSDYDITIGKWTANTFALLNRYQEENLMFNDKIVNVLFLHKNYDFSKPVKDLVKNSDFVFIGCIKYKD